MRARSLAASLELAAQEASELVELGERLQALIAQLAATSGQPEPAVLVEAQTADLLSQRLTGLAAFVKALARAAPAEASADIEAALLNLTLTEQARRLSGVLTPVAPESPGEPPTFWD